MIPTFEDYLKEPKALSLTDMQQIHADMVADIGTDTEALALYYELLRASAKYANIRAGWLLLSREEKLEQDSRRTSCHDALIIKCNKLARYITRQGKEAVWRKRLGDESDPYGRKRIGDFGCYLAFVSGVNAR